MFRRKGSDEDEELMGEEEESTFRGHLLDFDTSLTPYIEIPHLPLELRYLICIVSI